VSTIPVIAPVDEAARSPRCVALTRRRQVGEEQATRSRSSIERLALIVEADDVPRHGESSPEGAVTIMFSDIEGSTEMVERLGDEQWVRILRAHNRLVREAVRRNGGTEVKAQGDGFMLAFTSSRAGLRCAIEMQQRIASRGDEDGDRRIRIRIGLHSGFVIEEEHDYIGRNVILAARIADRARGGEVLVSERLKEFVEPSDDIRFLPAQDLALKGLSGTHRVYPVNLHTAN
jgi:class 3 adenylate cyclase